jgi:hypothetical protein
MKSRTPILLALLTLALCAAACGGGDDGSGSPQDSASTDLADAVSPSEVLPSDAAPGDVEPETSGPPAPPLPADPLPTPDNGTYVFSDGVNKLTLAYNDGSVFLLESSFGCVGENGCKVRQEFLPLTCNKAYEKGYSAPLVNGTFVIDGIKESDTLHGAVSSSQGFKLLYLLTPKVSCCSDWFEATAAWTKKDDCSGFATPDCDPYTDANCDEGMNCIFGANDKPVCMVAGEVEHGGKCGTQGNCADGVCMSLSTDTSQHCYKYCKSDGSCGYGMQCLEITDKQWKICSLPPDQFESCNLLEQSCTKAGEACYWTSSTINKPVCLPEGEGQKGDPCTDSTQCAKGLDCIAGKKCLKLCNTTEGQEPKCDSVFTGCSALYGPQNAGYCGD